MPNGLLSCKVCNLERQLGGKIPEEFRRSLYASIGVQTEEQGHTSTLVGPDGSLLPSTEAEEETTE